MARHAKWLWWAAAGIALYLAFKPKPAAGTVPYGAAVPIHLAPGEVRFVRGAPSYQLVLPKGASWQNGSQAPVLTASPQGSYSWLDGSGAVQSTSVMGI